MARIGPNGEVVIPKQVRDAADLAPGDPVIVDIQDGKVTVSRLRAGNLLGVLCGTEVLELHEGRRDYQEHLVEKFRRSTADAAR